MGQFKLTHYQSASLKDSPDFAQRANRIGNVKEYEREEDAVEHRSAKPKVLSVHDVDPPSHSFSAGA